MDDNHFPLRRMITAFMLGWTANKLGREEEKVLKESLLFRCSFLRKKQSREQVVRLCDVFLEPPVVGLLGLPNFELPVVGLPKLCKQTPGIQISFLT